MAPRPLSNLTFDSTAARFVWSGLRPGERGEPIELPEYSVLRAKLIGSLNGARVTLEGATGGGRYGALSAPIRKAGDVTFNAKPTHVRPVVAGGGPGTFLEITVIAVR